MITHLNYNQIDHKKWDGCISKAFNGRVYALSWYLNEMAYGWEALVEDDYISVMPLTGNKKAGINYLFQPFFTQQLGIFSTKLISPAQISKFINSIPRKYRYGELNLNSHNNPGPGNYELSYNLNHELDLIKPYELLHKAFSENTRRNIKKASTHNFTLSKSVTPEELVTLFRSTRGSMLNHLTELHYTRLISLMHRIIYHNAGYIIGCFQNNHMVAGVFFINYRNRYIFLFSAISEKGKKNGAMFWIISKTIQQLAGTATILDFEGSNDPNLARFYKSFGASEINYPRVVFNHLPYPLQITVNVAKKLRQIISF